MSTEERSLGFGESHISADVQLAIAILQQALQVFCALNVDLEFAEPALPQLFGC